VTGITQGCGARDFDFSNSRDRHCEPGSEAGTGECGAASNLTTAVIPAQAGTQYAAAFRFNHRRLWNTGSPAFAGDDSRA